ncbi:hypothetical protein C5D36_04680 [Rathayibacter sp. AY1C6]|uniref:SCO6880 family protein n=1 Tax=Rathayibacter sp. AY1C6 TaxID=2080539 RepID=UPI000CE759A7|nr:SCO6880 family protein [Rathayibacter sp. AY1C6]PPG17168.1 hypothetical protein C5D36_04680 [Rathayibacter sp. AY1C6]
MTKHFTVVLATEPDGAALVDQEQINNQVAEYGIWLANLGDEPGIEAASVTVETAPDTGTRLRGEVEGSMDPDAPLFARAMLQEVVETYPVGSATIHAYIALTFTATARINGKRRNAKEVAADLSARSPGLTSSLAATGAGAARPLSAQELCEVVRTAYDPDAALLIDQARAEGEMADLSWTDVGPAGAEAQWDSYRHDGAVSTSWTMTAPPRGVVQSNILARLLAPHRDIACKRVTLLYRPIDPARAAALVEAGLNAAQFNSSASTKAARLRMRPAFGSQDSAFAAALPLGLVLPRNLRIPNELREIL